MGQKYTQSVKNICQNLCYSSVLPEKRTEKAHYRFSLFRENQYKKDIQSGISELIGFNWFLKFTEPP